MTFDRYVGLTRYINARYQDFLKGKHLALLTQIRAVSDPNTGTTFCRGITIARNERKDHRYTIKDREQHLYSEIQLLPLGTNGVPPWTSRIDELGRFKPRCKIIDPEQTRTGDEWALINGILYEKFLGNDTATPPLDTLTFHEIWRRCKEKLRNLPLEIIRPPTVVNPTKVTLTYQQCLTWLRLTTVDLSHVLYHYTTSSSPTRSIESSFRVGIFEREVVARMLLEQRVQEERFWFTMVAIDKGTYDPSLVTEQQTRQMASSIVRQAILEDAVEHPSVETLDILSAGKVWSQSPDTRIIETVSPSSVSAHRTPESTSDFSDFGEGGSVLSSAETEEFLRYLNQLPNDPLPILPRQTSPPASPSSISEHSATPLSEQPGRPFFLASLPVPLENKDYSGRGTLTPMRASSPRSTGATSGEYGPLSVLDPTATTTTTTTSTTPTDLSSILGNGDIVMDILNDLLGETPQSASRESDFFDIPRSGQPEPESGQSNPFDVTEDSDDWFSWE